ncbi:hypothetical protein AnigIFM63604_006329 [Aspergillus niger]|uniref:Uncharacterized protein n=1 Tax=Aspergillus niger TaxID=5061 RepID=A0A9W6A3J5_ASPNG|nr:hypothetical protein AnigIFM63604_006329 [Aspergillus niger]
MIANTSEAQNASRSRDVLMTRLPVTADVPLADTEELFEAFDTVLESDVLDPMVDDKNEEIGDDNVVDGRNDLEEITKVGEGQPKVAISEENTI